MSACCCFVGTQSRTRALSSRAQVDSAEELEAVAARLRAAAIAHRVWTEQPENFPTCLATQPYPKPAIQALFKGLKLMK